MILLVAAAIVVPYTTRAAYDVQDLTRTLEGPNPEHWFGTDQYGRDLLTLKPAELRKVRGRGMAIVFQDPTSSLHPMLNIERQLTEHLLVHMRMSRAQARQRCVARGRHERAPQARRPDARRNHDA